LNGVEAWRALPAEEPPNLEKMLRDARNDIVKEELDPSPFRTVALLLLPVNAMPCVGQVWRVVVPAERRAAIEYALTWHGGFLACAVDVSKAPVLPRGAVGVEVQDVSEQGDGRVIATLRGVNCLRIIDRSTPTSRSHAKPLVQEVFEWTEYEEACGDARVLDELRELVSLFTSCGQLQRDTGIWAAGDLWSRSLEELTDAAVEVSADVDFRGIDGDRSSLKVATQRRVVLAAHSAITALKDGKRATFLCDPCSALRRTRQLARYFRLMQSLLAARVRR